MSIIDQIRPSTSEPAPACHSLIPSAETLREQRVRCETCPHGKKLQSGQTFCAEHRIFTARHGFCHVHPAINKREDDAHATPVEKK